SQNSLSAIEERMIPKPSLFKWLTQLHFYWRQLGNADNWTAGQIVTGLQTMIRKTLGNEEVLPKVGTTGTAVKSLYPFDNGHITWIDTLQWFEPRWLKFWSDGYNNGWTYQGELGTIVEKNPFWAAGPLTRIYYPSERANYIPDHRLSWVTYEPIRSNSPYGWTEYAQLGALALGWTHESVDPNNTIVSDKITTIPAVKAYDIGASGPGQVIKGPGSTGGDLVSLSYNTSMKVRLTPSTVGRNQSYRVRIRYASTGNTQMYVEKWSRYFNPYGQTYNVTPTYSSGALTYGTFKYFDTFNIYTGEPDFEIIIQNKSNTTLIIDKIEFIPVNPILEPPAPGPGPGPGTYIITTALDNGWDLIVKSNDPNYNVALWTYNPNITDTSAQYRFEYDSSKNAYQMYSVAYSQYSVVLTLDIKSNNVHGARNTQQLAQYWMIADAGNGYVYLINKADPRKVLAVANSSVGYNVNIIGSDYTGGTNQKFKLIKLS
ncbi:delta endotoxin C-terminal domain-containing protein, partial [Bacillus wiedmannii]|uniref:delta endotoxin C-terminal domain-containing protein n=1 Tax=Bacillus wiedmannii TaxID=1890302 RepID=UPI003D22CAD5